MSYIYIENLSYKYPTSEEDVIHDINISFEKGKLYALVGANESGKTTICNIIRGFIPNFHKGDIRGKLYIDGKDSGEWSMEDLARKMGFIFQNPFIQISGIKDSVFEEIAYGMENLGIEEAHIKKKVLETINLLNIGDIQNKHPDELSGGQKQRVVLASSIVMDPDIFVIDEPTSQLDPQGTEEIFNIINILKEKGKTIILAEHKIELIAKYADNVVVIDNGRVAMQGTAKEILSNEKLVDHGVALPQYSNLGISMKKKYKEFSEVPITYDEAVTLLKEWLNTEVGREIY